MTDIRIFFSKTDRAKYISHLDLNRCMQRAIRRAKLPVWETEGFNPHTYITFALPLSLGTEGVCESMDTRLTEDIPFEKVAEMLNAALPSDIRVIRIAEPVKKHTEIMKSVYEIDTDCDKDAFMSFLGGEKIITQKKTKKGIVDIDLKTHIENVHLENGMIIMTLPSGIEFNINPSLVFEAFEKLTMTDIGRLNIKRTEILCKDGAVFE